MKRRRILLIVLAIVLLGLAAGGYKWSKGLHGAEVKDELPLAEVKRGTIDLRVHAIGELKARNEMMLSAPSIGGDSLQITQLAASGQMVKKNDMVVEFDPSEQHYKMEQSHSELQQAEQEIVKAKADAVVLAAEDKVALLKAKFNVRRAELDVQKNELLSKIDGDKNQLALQQAQRALAELEKDMDSHKASGEATIYLAQEKANKARITMQQAQENLDKLRVIAPMDGVISIQKNMNASGGFYFSGMSMPYYHAGDQVQPGTPIAKVVEPLEMDLKCTVSERDHANIRMGQPVEVVFDAIPGSIFHGKVKSMGNTSMRQMFSTSSGGAFEIVTQLEESDARLRAGFTAQIVFVGNSKANVLMAPRQALFLKDGKRIVYLKNGNSYEQHEVKILSESESRVAIEGVAEGSRIAMIDPTAPRKTSGIATGNGGTP
jgi:multidrug efflux pump subunit AcrA (membrane-fusion protein)